MKFDRISYIETAKKAIGRERSGEAAGSRMDMLGTPDSTHQRSTDN